jgi:hypothetical protein
MGPPFDLKEGAYRAELSVDAPLAAPLVAQFTVADRIDELRDTTVDLTALTQVASASGGQLVTIDRTRDLLLPRPPPRLIGTLPPTPLWNHWMVALLIAVAAVGLATTEWLIGRRYGWA